MLTKFSSKSVFTCLTVPELGWEEVACVGESGEDRVREDVGVR